MSPAAPASPAYDKLISLLRELFQLDQPDLDFGLYRVLHARAAEIDKFLSLDLLPQVRKDFAHYQPADKAAIQKELDKVIASLTEAEMDPEASPKVKTLRQRLATEAVDLGGLEREVFDHLYAFFRRYYAEGDFLARRVYKEGTYAIPYEGEEVKLHWANRDQYYIKTSEYLRDYAFRLRPQDAARPMRVHFRLADAAEGEHGNVKAAEGKDRVFILREGTDAYALDAKAQELTFFFEYRPATADDREPATSNKKPETDKKPKPPTQKELLQAAQARIEALAAADAALAPWLAELTQPHTRADGSLSEKSRLQVNLERYTARNTFDYFIHKDLGGFLQRELDFYLKNEVLHLDNIEADSAPRVEQFLSKLRVLRKVAHHLIDFLAQLEDFQRKLWLKKKFVVETQWCVTLDKVPAALLPEVAANAAQRQEWVELFGIEALAADAATPGYSEPLTVGFLQAYPHLVLDTRHFPAAFTERLLAGLDGNLDELTDGLLIHGENFQALNLLQERYKEQVKCIYIDPPYNTASSSIPYKNNYKHSSWLTMMYDRLGLMQNLIPSNGAIFVSIDKAERTVLHHAMDEVFGEDNRVEELIWSMNTNNSQAPNYSTNHEYVLVYAKNKSVVEQDRSMFREPKPGYEEMMEIASGLNSSYPSISIIESEIQKLFKSHKLEFKEFIENQGLEWEEEKGNDPWKGLYNYSGAEYRTTDGILVEESEARQKGAKIWIWRESDASMPATKQAASTKDANHINWRFYKPLHPVTGKPCPHPKSGWKFAYDDNKDSPDKRSFVSLERDGRIVWGRDNSKVPQLKRMLHEVETNVGKSVFQDYSDGEKQTSAMFGKSGVFLAPKHSSFVARFIRHSASESSYILDCFGGSGSSAHAVIQLNREEVNKRKYITVEMGHHFDSVLKPRILKAVYSQEWRGGKPSNTNTGISQLIKVIRLESYEDTLNNLKLQRAEPVQTTLFPATDTPAIAAARQDYVLRYLLDVESRGSRSLLDVPAFRDPTAYTLDVKAPGSDQTEPQAVDLLETFNYLLGLRVHQVGVPQTLVAEFEHADHVEPGDGAGRLRLKGALRKAATGPWWVRPVTGTLANGRRVLIIWRKLTADAAQDNLVLNAWFEKHDYSVRDTEFDFIYVNGDNNLENLRQPDETWKVQLIEEAFHRLLFAE